ncbi:MAG: T9SS type A sorting domain-containing protein [Bacteroidetes bacterium]|nr:T9SS type A sorting domain-containing protein [Bacteroidota bacterium]
MTICKRVIRCFLLISTFISVLTAQQSFWNQLNISINTTIYAITVTAQGNIFAGTANGVFCSFDAGATWSVRSSGLPYGADVGTIASDMAGNVYAGIYSYGVYMLKSDDTVWSEMKSGLTKTNIRSVAVHPVKQNVYVGTSNSGSFLWRKGDTSWSVMDTSLSDIHVQCFLLDTLNNLIFAGTWSGIFRSSNEGETWERLGSTTSFLVTTLAITSQGVLFAGSSNVGIFRSTDNGMQWTPKNTAMFDSLVSNLVVNAKDIIYTSTSMGVFFSTNNGDTWISITGTMGRVNYLTLDAGHYLYAGTQSGTMYRSKISTTTGVEAGSMGAVSGFALYQNYPNPFNPVTVISYSLPVETAVRLAVIDAMGREIEVLVNGRRDAGLHRVTFDAARVASGIYFYRITAGMYATAKKLVVIK